MKKFKRVLTCVGVTTLIMGLSTNTLLARTDKANYEYVDDKHAVSNILHKTNTEYTYSLFCIETQKTQPSTEKTIECNFCEESIEGAFEYVKDKHGELVKENDELIANAKKMSEKIELFKKGVIA